MIQKVYRGEVGGGGGGWGILTKISSPCSLIKVPYKILMGPTKFNNAILSYPLKLFLLKKLIRYKDCKIIRGAMFL